MSKKNEVIAVGRVTSIKQSTSGKTVLTIVTQNGKNDVYIPFICPDGIPAGVGHRSHATVVGHVESVTFHPEENKTRHELRFVADHIEPSKTLAESAFGTKGKFFPAPTCSVAVAGTIKTIVDEKEWLRIMLEVDIGNGRTTYIRTSMKRLERQPDLKEGDEIGIVGSLTSPRKTRDGKTQIYLDIVVSDLAKLSKA